jgi:cytokinin dehydrogenase
MHQGISRREFGKRLTANATGAAVLAHLPACSIQRPLLSGEALRAELPELRGALLTDDAARQSGAVDFGQIVHRMPLAVLKPRSVSDMVKVVEIANRRGIKLAMRGQGHAMFGQSQVNGGVVIDSSTLNSVRLISYRGRPAVEAGAGALWGDILDAAYAHKLTPPVNVDPGYLSVGGTLSTGGFGGMTWRDGFQTDHVLELEIVSGDGQFITCSDESRPELFNAALAGMGQCGIIVKAVIPLIPAPTHVRFFVFSYGDIQSAIADMTLFVRDGRFNHLDGRSASRPAGGFTYNLEGGAFFDAPNDPSDARLLADLKFSSRTATTMTYPEYYRRQGPLKPSRHPWLYLCLPASRFLEYATKVFATPAEYAFAAPRYSVWRRSGVKRPLALLPDEDPSIRFQLSRFPPATADMDSLLAMNRVLYERARDMGGTRLTTAAIPFSQSDWVRHFGPSWAAFRDAKKRFDPKNVLTPGPGIFAES